MKNGSEWVDWLVRKLSGCDYEGGPNSILKVYFAIGALSEIEEDVFFRSSDILRLLEQIAGKKESVKITGEEIWFKL